MSVPHRGPDGGRDYPPARPDTGDPGCTQPQTTDGGAATTDDGAGVHSADALVQAIGEREPGESVTLHWTDADGQSHRSTITLGASPLA